MRECRNNYAHGPMKLKSKTVTVRYRDQDIACEKIVYACSFCDYELHEKWMEKKLAEQLDRAYRENHAS